MSDSSDDFRGLLALTAGGAVISYGGWSSIKRINRVKDSAKQLISAASAGQVELEAVAWPIDKVEKCIEGKSCILLELILEEYSGSGKNKSWKEVWRYTSNRPFLAFDQSGFVTIKPSADHFIDVHKERTYEPHRMQSTQQMAFNAFYGGENIFNTPKVFGFSLGSSFRIKEKKILLGSPVLIHGVFNPEDKIRFVNLDPKLEDFRERCNKLLLSESFRKRFFDKNKDGSVNREELIQGFERVLQMSEGEMSNTLKLLQTGENQCRFYGLVSGNNDVPLHIADTFEEQYLKSKSAVLAWLSFSSGMFVFFLGLYLMAQYFGQR